MDSPSYVDIEECKDKNDSAKDRCDVILESWDPGIYFWSRLCGGKGGICLGVVVRLDVWRWCRRR